MLSIVLPCYNEEKNILVVYKQIKSALSGVRMEIIFVDDGSSDETFQRIIELSATDSSVKGISLSRNFGHQVALLAGLKEAAGEIVISLDADGQHPPALIPLLLEKQKEGYDIVNTRRLDSDNTGWLKRKSSRWFYRLMNMMSDVKIESAAADFRLMTREALIAYLQIDEHNRFTRGLVGWMGFRQAVVEFQPETRIFGKSKYTLRRMLRFALDGITSFSSLPLRMSMYFGTLVFLLAVVYSVYALVMHFSGNTNPGWTSLLIVILLLGGVQLLTIGIIGEYLARIFNEVKGRPHYFIRERTGQDLEKAEKG